MQNEKLQINLAAGMERGEIILREVQGVNELPVKPPVKIKIEGTIGSVQEFLRQRVGTDQIEEKRCHILFDRDKISIQLVYNEHDEYLRGEIIGKLELNPKFVEFGINSGKVWTPSELGMFLKMNKSFFLDKGENMKLVSELMNFTATVNNKIDKSIKESGDRTDNFSQIVNSNLPKTFTVSIPIFKGCSAETIEIETFAQISGRDVAFVLLSPGANQVLEEMRDKVIDEQLSKIKEIASGIAIIEQ
ncbi:MAG: hypothetical protein M0R37_12970 [Bacteroidales bacterium]|nr:hypothetical protein [Bacteroidales bacterium]